MTSGDQSFKERAIAALRGQRQWANDKLTSTDFKEGHIHGVENAIAILQALDSFDAKPELTREKLNEIIRCSQGLVRTAFVPKRGEILVVRQWWEGLSEALEALD
jgi:hypothetical protein